MNYFQRTYRHSSVYVVTRILWWLEFKNLQVNNADLLVGYIKENVWIPWRKLPGFKLQFCLFLAVWSLATSLAFSKIFFFLKMEIKYISFKQSWELKYIKHTEWFRSLWSYFQVLELDVDLRWKTWHWCWKGPPYPLYLRYLWHDNYRCDSSLNKLGQYITVIYFTRHWRCKDKWTC